MRYHELSSEAASPRSVCYSTTKATPTVLLVEFAVLEVVTLFVDKAILTLRTTTKFIFYFAFTGG